MTRPRPAIMLSGPRPAHAPLRASSCSDAPTATQGAPLLRRRFLPPTAFRPILGNTPIPKGEHRVPLYRRVVTEGLMKVSRGDHGAPRNVGHTRGGQSRICTPRRCVDTKPCVPHTPGIRRGSSGTRPAVGYQQLASSCERTQSPDACPAGAHLHTRAASVSPANHSMHAQPRRLF